LNQALLDQRRSV